MKLMKFLLIVLLGVLVLPQTALAQDNNTIVLNDATPSVDVMVTLASNSTGVVGLDLKDVVVTMTDAAGETVFFTADPRLRSVELSIAPNTGGHTLRLERMPGVVEAYARLNGLAQLTNYFGSVPQDSTGIELVDTMPDRQLQNTELFLTASQPGTSVDLTLPDEQTSLVTAEFTDAHATTQLVDASGVPVASSYNGHVDGMNMVLDGGAYQFTILGGNISADIIANIRTQPIAYQGITLVSAENSSQASCLATVDFSLLNLRSGPGTGYSVTGAANQGETFPVGGTNSTGSWFVIGAQDGSSWAYGGGMQMSGDCSDLTVFDIPYREAPQAEVITVQQPPQVVTVPNASSAPAAASVATSTDGGTVASANQGEGEYHEEDEHHEEEDHEDEQEEHSDDHPEDDD